MPHRDRAPWRDPPWPRRSSKSPAWSRPRWSPTAPPVPDSAALDRLISGCAPDLRVIHAKDPADADAPAAQVVSNLWGRAVISAPGADSWLVPDRALFTRTAEPAACENHPAIVELTFARGIPVAVSGIRMSFAEIVEVVDTIAGDHGVGRTDAVCGPVGRQWREVGEAPAAAALSAALAALERAALDPSLVGLKASLVPDYLAVLQDGGWFSDTRRALDALVDAAMSGVSGTVRLMLCRGACRVVGRVVQAAAADGVRPDPAAQAAL